MKYNTIIFDLDGTLLNTLDDLRDSLNAVLIQNGYQPKSLDEVRHFVGNGVRRLVRLSVPECSEEDVDFLLAQFKEHYKNNMQIKTRPYSGILELLTQLNRLKYKTAIVSNKFDPAVKALSKEYFGNLIHAAIGETDEVRRKPAPDVIFKAVEDLGSRLNQTIMVGDSETDVMTAKNAGIPCIGVTWGFRDRDILISEGADYIIDTPKEILKLL